MGRRGRYRLLGGKMVRAWIMDDSQEDQRLPHMTDPPQFVSMDELQERCGVEYFQINADDYQNDQTLQKIRRERGYSYEDTITVNKDKLPAYESKIQMFFEEHLHTDEEIRLFLDGEGYFDARDNQGRWVRIEMVKGDMIVLPAGIYHRFTPGPSDYVKANRYFIGEPVWKAYNIGADTDSMEVRKSYLSSQQAKGIPA